MAAIGDAFGAVQAALRAQPRRWLVTGAAGFIGGHLVETLLGLGQQVTGLDNFSTGRRTNLDAIRAIVGTSAWGRFRFIEGDIRDPATCRSACEGQQIVLHQAAVGSVPRSVQEPLVSHASNDTGFVHMLVAARDARVQRFVYASSSSIYGDHPGLPKVEDQLGRVLSPYAATKLTNEIYAGAWSRTYGLRSIALRYFNVFGPRQDPAGPYAAVIPRWIEAVADGSPVQVNGDGETSRDFCFVENAVQANLLAAVTNDADALDTAYNVACGDRTTLNELLALIRELVAAARPQLATPEVTYAAFRAGDVRHSLADISKARRLLGYEPRKRVREGLALTVAAMLGEGATS